MGLLATLFVQWFGIGLLAVALPTPAAAQTCDPISVSVSASYAGTALSNVVTRKMTCTGLTAGTTYTLCTDGSGITGTGGSTVQPYRKLDNGSGVKANWQLYSSDGTAVTNAFVVLGTATAAQLNGGTADLPFELRFPVQAAGYGTFTTQLSPMVINVKTAANCQGSITASANYTLNYQVTVPPSCSALTAGTLDFGNISDTSAANSPASAQINVTCTTGSPYTVYLDGGVNNQSGQNRMRNGTSYLRYGLFSNPGRTTAWTSSQGVAGTGTGSAQALTVYGRVPVQPTPPVGSYADTVVVTLTY